MADLDFSINNNQFSSNRNCIVSVNKNYQFFTTRKCSKNIFINFNVHYSTNPSIDLVNRIYPTIRTCQTLKSFNRQFNTQRTCNKLEFIVNSGFDEVLSLRIPYSISFLSSFDIKLSIEGILDKTNPIKKLFDLLPNFFKDFEEE